MFCQNGEERPDPAAKPAQRKTPVDCIQNASTSWGDVPRTQKHTDGGEPKPIQPGVRGLRGNDAPMSSSEPRRKRMHYMSLQNTALEHVKCNRLKISSSNPKNPVTKQYSIQSSVYIFLVGKSAGARSPIRSPTLCPKERRTLNLNLQHYHESKAQALHTWARTLECWECRSGLVANSIPTVGKLFSRNSPRTMRAASCVFPTPALPVSTNLRV